jgi:predicted Zn-dependent peptidase
MRAATLFFSVALACGQVKLPQYTREVLPNGTVIVVMPRSGIPLVHFRVLIRGGAESDPLGKAGLAMITASLLQRGTEGRAAQQFADELDSLGATLVAGEDDATAAISAEFLAKDFDRGLELISDAVLHPAFNESEVRKVLSGSSDRIRAAKDNPQAAIASYFRAAFYGRSHPYGNPPDEASLKSIDRKDIVAYHRNVYCGRNIVIVAAGNFHPTEAKAKLRHAFGTAPAGTAYSWTSAAVPEHKNALLLIDKPDTTQTYFEIAQLGISRTSPDRFVLELINSSFRVEGRFSAMLQEELRVNSGLTYHPSCRLEKHRLPGAISISAYTKTANTVRAIDLALEVLGRFHEQGVTAEQLDSAKAYVKGLYPTQTLETIAQLALIVGELEMYGLPREEVDQYFERIDAVTLEQTNEAVRKYYRRQNLTFVILGSAAKIREAMRKYDSDFTEIAIKDAGWGHH